MKLRALVGGSLRVAWRRAGSDRGLLLGALLLVTVTVFLSLTGPRQVESAADEAARAAVNEAGSRADVVANFGATIGAGPVTYRDEAAVTKIQNAATELRASLPPAVQAVTGPPSAAVLSGRLAAESPQGGSVVRFAWLWREGSAGVTWVEGVAPRASAPPVEAPAGPTEVVAEPVSLVEIGLTRPEADAVRVQVGDQLEITGPTRGLVQAVVSGIFSPVDPTDPLWTTVPGLLEPTRGSANGPSVPSLGLLLSDDSLPDVAVALQRGALTTRYQFPARAGSLLSADVDDLRASVSALVANPSALTLAGGSAPAVTTELDTVLGDHLARLRGAQAQASVLLVGLVAVGALALLLVGRLVVGRRQTLLAAERARGASVASVALRLALESVPLAAVGLGLGVGGSWLVDRAAPWTWWPGIAVAVVAVLAVPVAGARVASISWTGQRSPANRKDRDRIRGRRRTQRTVVELCVVVLAVAAASAARGRGVLQTQTQDVDLLLAATPVLLAAAAAVVVLRAFPALLRLAARAAVGRRGPVPLVATARAMRTGDIGLPLLALTIALGLLVFSGVTAASVHRGEERAADEAVGADVRLDGEVEPEILSDLRAATGVTAVATGTRLTGRTFNGDALRKATLLAVDAADDHTVVAANNSRYTGELALLRGTGGASARPRAVVSRVLADEVAAHGAKIFVGGATVELDVVGVTGLGRPGEALVIVDRTALAPFTPAPIEPDLTWVDGSGAVAAVAAASDHGALTNVIVTDRSAWLDHLRASPLVRSLVALLTVAALVLALYAALALALTVVATSAERGRTLSCLRTLGLDRQAAWRITLGELLPLTAASAVAGALIGVGVPLALAGALGLNQLTGEAGVTEVAITAGPFLLTIGASLVALLVSVLVEAALRWRENLGATLRLGER